MLLVEIESVERWVFEKAHITSQIYQKSKVALDIEVKWF
jgi:hypothetical protein